MSPSVRARLELPTDRWKPDKGAERRTDGEKRSKGGRKNEADLRERTHRRALILSQKHRRRGTHSSKKRRRKKPEGRERAGEPGLKEKNEGKANFFWPFVFWVFERPQGERKKARRDGAEERRWLFWVFSVVEPFFSSVLVARETAKRGKTAGKKKG
ncbi:hypothetical protein BT93_C0507 [Corymbia citriodora subsp. variegata]|nr:hypothetical protein BT93_C0507 [Corymbia citriodora subsp. variegata]